MKRKTRDRVLLTVKQANEPQDGYCTILYDGNTTWLSGGVAHFANVELAAVLPLGVIARPGDQLVLREGVQG